MCLLKVYVFRSRALIFFCKQSFQVNKPVQQALKVCTDSNSLLLGKTEVAVSLLFLLLNNFKQVCHYLFSFKSVTPKETSPSFCILSDSLSFLFITMIQSFFLIQIFYINLTLQNEASYAMK